MIQSQSLTLGGSSINLSFMLPYLQGTKTHDFQF